MRWIDDEQIDLRNSQAFDLTIEVGPLGVRVCF